MVKLAQLDAVLLCAAIEFFGHQKTRRFWRWKRWFSPGSTWPPPFVYSFFLGVAIFGSSLLRFGSNFGSFPCGPEFFVLTLVDSFSTDLLCTRVTLWVFFWERASAVVRSTTGLAFLEGSRP